MKTKLLSSEEKELLRRLGLSKRAIFLYGHLLQHGSLTSKQAADLSSELPSAEYRLFSQLERAGLVRREAGRPVVFAAVPKDIGLKAAYLQFQSGLEQLVRRVGSEESDYHLEVIVGRQALYEKYIELAERSQHEVCIYAIGIAYSKELERSQQTTLRRGVRIRHVLQQIKPSNFHVAHKWQRLGVKLRYSQSERGFHFMLFDSRTLLISFSDPENTNDRLTILTNNPSAVRLFEVDFERIWDNAQPVDA